MPKKQDHVNFVRWLQQRVHWDIGVIPAFSERTSSERAKAVFCQHAALDMAIVCSPGVATDGIARHAETALVVRDDVDAWFGAIQSLIEDRELRSRLAASARSIVQRDETTARTAESLIAVLDCLRPDSGAGRESTW
jgi:glycosyltransferase involved in cell wall biosynthesis